MKKLTKGEANRVDDSNIILLGTGRTGLKQQRYNATVQKELPVSPYVPAKKKSGSYIILKGRCQMRDVVELQKFVVVCKGFS